MTRVSEAVKKTLEERAAKGKTESKSPSSGGMKKDVQVKTHTRRTKSGKVTTVKSHTAKRDAAKQTPSSEGVKAPSGKELDFQRAEKASNEVIQGGLDILEALCEGTLKYKKGKTNFDSAVNAVTALCLPKKGRYGFDDSGKDFIKITTNFMSDFLVTTNFPEALCSAVKKKLGDKISKVSPNIRKELNRVRTPVTFDLRKARGWARAGIIESSWNKDKHVKEYQRSPEKREAPRFLHQEVLTS